MIGRARQTTRMLCYNEVSSVEKQKMKIFRAFEAFEVRENYKFSVVIQYVLFMKQ